MKIAERTFSYRPYTYGQESSLKRLTILTRVWKTSRFESRSRHRFSEWRYCDFLQFLQANAWSKPLALTHETFRVLTRANILVCIRWWTTAAVGTVLLNNSRSIRKKNITTDACRPHSGIKWKPSIIAQVLLIFYCWSNSWNNSIAFLSLHRAVSLQASSVTISVTRIKHNRNLIQNASTVVTKQVRKSERHILQLSQGSANFFGYYHRNIFVYNDITPYTWKWGKTN
jgi:hypothetical protein